MGVFGTGVATPKGMRPRPSTVLWITFWVPLVLGSLSVRADDFKYFKEPVLPPPADNTGWTCSVEDLQASEATVALISLSATSASSTRVVELREGRLRIRFSLGRQDRQKSEPGEQSPNFLSYSAEGPGVDAAAAKGIIGSDDMDACAPTAGRLGALHSTLGLLARCVPDAGFSNYFGVTSPDCENKNAAEAILSRFELTVGVADAVLPESEVTGRDRVSAGRQVGADKGRSPAQIAGIEEESAAAADPSKDAAAKKGAGASRGAP